MVNQNTDNCPLISIITVVYNNKDLLEKTIQSVVIQRFKSFEYIVIDGGSVDGTLDVIKEYETNITKWVSEKDNGIYHAMNKGIDLAKGQWICFLNSGDVFVDEEVLNKVSEAISQHENPDVLYGDIYVETKDGSLRHVVAAEPTNKHRMYFCHQSAFAKTELLRRFHFDEKHKMSADLKFFKACYYAGCKFTHVPFPVVIYDRQGISHTNREAGLRDNIAVIGEMDKGFKKWFFKFRLYFVIYWRKLKA